MGRCFTSVVEQAMWFGYRELAFVVEAVGWSK